MGVMVLIIDIFLIFNIEIQYIKYNVINYKMVISNKTYTLR